MKREIEIEIEERPFRERDKNIWGGKKHLASRISRGNSHSD
jgi:hypothetical protein